MDPTHTLWACLLFPSLPLDVFARGWTRAESGRPFIVSTGGHYPRVVAANDAARAAGVKRGQLISAALALAPDLVQRDRDAMAEAAALAELATSTLRFTPMACLAPPNAVVAEIAGSLRLFGGMSRLATQLGEGARALGYATRLGLAPTPGAALAFARAGVEAAIPDRADLPKALAPLPLALFDLEPRALDTLAAAGVTTFGAADRLPRDAFARRFGPGLVAQLDRAAGRILDVRVPFEPPPRFTSKLELPAPVHDAEALGFAVNRLVHVLTVWLTARGLGIVRLTLALAHERYLTLPATEVPFAFGAPARASAHLIGVLRERLARVALPAPVEAIALTSEETAPLAGRSLSLLPGDDADAVEVPLADRLRARLGEGAVLRIAPQPEHRPELAAREAPPASSVVGPASAGQQHRSKAEALPARVAPAPRPLWLLSEPEPLGARLEATPWVLGDGPERIEAGWWDGRDVRRDYFVATAPDGERAWIYRDHRYGTDDGEWFLHGLFA